MDAVLAALRTLEDALIHKPNTLPVVEQNLAALRDQVGRGDFAKGVTHVLLDGGAPLTLRQTAGMVLKQQLKVDPPTGEDAALRQMILGGVTTPQPREVVNVVSGIVKDMAQGWGMPLTGALLQAPLAPDTAVVPCITTILECHDLGEEVLDQFYRLIPKALELLPRTDAGGQATLVHLLKVLYEEPTSEAQEDLCREYTMRYLETLLSVVHDKSVVLEALPGSVAHWSGQVTSPTPPIQQAFALVLEALRAGTDAQKIVACRFWTEAAQAMDLSMCIDELVRHLLPCLQWSDEVLLDDCGLTNGNDGNVVEKEVQVVSCVRRNAEQDDDEDDGEDQAERLVGCSVLRTEAQQCLSTLAGEQGDAAAAAVCNLLQEHKSAPSGNWKQREVMLTMLGAVADGCVDVFVQRGITEHVINEAVETIRTFPEHALVRDAAYWLIGEYAAALNSTEDFEDDDDEDEETFPPLVMNVCAPALLNGLRDGNKRCQFTCIQALKMVAGRYKQANSYPLVKVLLEVAVSGLQTENRCRAFEAATSMMRSVDIEETEAAALPEVVLGYVQSLLNGCAADVFVRRNDLPSVLWALTEACKFLRQENGNVVAGILNMVHGIIDAVNNIAVATGKLDHGVQSSIIALDVATALCDVFPNEFASSAEVVKRSLSLGLSLSERMANDPSAIADRESLVQSCASISADLATTTYSTVADVAPELSKYLIQVVCGGSIRMDYTSGYVAMSNVCWALGEFFVRVPPDVVAGVFAPTLEPLVKKVVSFVADDEQYGDAAGSSSVNGAKQNAAILLGRLGYREMPIAAALTPEVVDAWCTAMHSLDDDNLEEKIEGVAGLIGALLRGHASAPNPASLLLAAGTMAVWKGRPHPSFAPLVKGVVAALLATDLPTVFSQHMPEPLQIALVFRYYESRRKGHWSRLDANKLAADANGKQFDESTWKSVCQQLHASPSTGLGKRRVIDMYSSGLLRLHLDAPRVANLILTNLRSAAGL
eukprot:TRINITY_DN14241_c0_g1_i1.p1 TRINITY_DN14241_c0_g1~~TRINITY_DN14241_c0_g1_i1.p1  ORF type:complete len:1023 (+),score=373.70 TRINITY_DN14241_c0_g1_i1:89-3070(+)